MNSEFTPSSPPNEDPAVIGRRGQALVEYVLILALLAIGFGFALAATGPAIGNVFSNVIHNVVGENPPNAIDLAGVGGAPVNFWQTVTWVAQNPQLETPFPTPLGPVPTVGSGGPQAFLSPTPFPTRTPTVTNTSTPTTTPTAVPTGGPSPTMPDRAFEIPFVEQVVDRDDFTSGQLSNTTNWRIADPGPALTGTWEVEWFGTRAGNNNDAQFTLSNGSGSRQPVLTQSNFNADVSRPYNLDFDWADGRPAGVSFSNDDNWGGIFTGTFTFDRTTTLRFNTVSANDFIRIRRGTSYANALSQQPFILDSAYATGNQPIQTFGPGTHVFVVEFGHNTDNASMRVEIERLHNTDDRLGAIDAAQCNVGRTSDDDRATNAASAGAMFAQSNNSDDSVTWNANRTCFLELRGYIDLVTGINPQLSFWDMWDFTGTGGTNMTVDLQVADYVSDGSGGVNRGALDWRTIPLRSGGTFNYNWTRTQIDLAQVSPALTSNRMALRFRISNTSTSVNANGVRWFLDDIQVTSRPNPNDVFTVGSGWNFNNRDHLNDFIFDSDSSRTLESAGRSPASSAWRWNLTNTRTRGGICCSLEDSPDDTPVFFAGLNPAQPTGAARVHYVELRRPIDLRSTVAPATDLNGNSGTPILTFWHSFEADDENIRLVVEYSRDDMTFAPGEAATPRTWIEIPRDGLLLDYTAPPVGGTALASVTNPNRATSRTQPILQPVQISLTQIPNWDTQPFRLRFAMYLNGEVGSNRGWWIDDVFIERDNQSLYISYPFIDSAENASFTRQNWRTNVSWGATGERGGTLFSSTAYTDSPGTRSIINTANVFEMRRTLDLLRDTPANTGAVGEGTTRPAATRPFLTFYHQRNMEETSEFRVELWTPVTGQWVSVWRYSGASSGDDLATDLTDTLRQDAWERVEVNLTQALLTNLRTQNTGWVWGGTGALSVTGNGTANQTDDDIRLRFVIATGANDDNGVWVDEIRIDDLTEVAHRAWGPTPFTTTVTGVGDGPLLDNIETSSLNLPSNWFDRFHTSSNWTAVDATNGFTRSGGLAIHDSPRTSGGSNVNYVADSFHIVEYRPIIDLRGLTATQLPMLDFWTRFAIAAGDTWRIQIATENTSDTGEQRYNNLGGWNEWVNVNFTPDGNTPLQARGPGNVWTWLRTRVNLSSFVGQRIRVRWLIHANNGGEVEDGLYLDNISVTWGRNVFTPPFNDPAESMGNWVAEGAWGLAPDFFFGSGSTTPALGSFQWQGFVIDCNNDTRAAAGSNTSCNATGYRRILDHYYGSPTPQLDWSAGTGYPDSVYRMPGLTDIDYFLTNGRIPGTPSNDFNDTVTARWRRVVNLEPGTYQIQVIGDDGFRLRIDNTAGTTLATRDIIDSWINGQARLISTTMTVTANITRTLELDWYENSGSATIALYITRSSFSLTNSPNVLQSNGRYDPPIASSPFSHASLISNGVFDFTGNPNPVLTYRRMFELSQDNSIRVQVSIDNGLTWVDVRDDQTDSLNLNGTWNNNANNSVSNATRRPPNDSWQVIRSNLVNINMGGGVTCCGNRNDVMIRFLFNNLAFGNNTSTGDGAYITTIRVQ